MQTRVPFVLWLSRAFGEGRGVNADCLRGYAGKQAVSHDFLFHSLLGIFGVRTQVYEARLDLFASCRRPG